jgi:hypothetical protein
MRLGRHLFKFGIFRLLGPMTEPFTTRFIQVWYQDDKIQNVKSF